MRKVILYIAVSLDGYIADREGGVGWLDELSEACDGDGGYAAFLKEIDTVVMGRNTCQQITEELSPGNWPYEGLDCYVLTHRAPAGVPYASFVSESPEALVSRLRRRPGKGIWICGGASVARQLMAAGMIDEYRLSLMPVLLGGGVRLFPEDGAAVPLSLARFESSGGMLHTVYLPRGRANAE